MFRAGFSSCWLRPIINRKAIFEVSSASFSAQFVSASCCFINCHLMCSFADQIICNRGRRIHGPFRTKSMYPLSLYSLIFISNQSQRCHRLEQAMKYNSMDARKVSVFYDGIFHPLLAFCVCSCMDKSWKSFVAVVVVFSIFHCQQT